MEHQSAILSQRHNCLMTTFTVKSSAANCSVCSSRAISQLQISLSVSSFLRCGGLQQGMFYPLPVDGIDLDFYTWKVLFQLLASRPSWSLFSAVSCIVLARMLFSPILSKTHVDMESRNHRRSPQTVELSILQSVLSDGMIGSSLAVDPRRMVDVSKQRECCRARLGSKEIKLSIDSIAFAWISESSPGYLGFRERWQISTNRIIVPFSFWESQGNGACLEHAASF